MGLHNLHRTWSSGTVGCPPHNLDRLLSTGSRGLGLFGYVAAPALLAPDVVHRGRGLRGLFDNDTTDPRNLHRALCRGPGLFGHTT